MERLIDIDFNALDTAINLQTWVVVFEFFGIGVAQAPPQPVSPVPSEGRQQWQENSEQGFTLLMYTYT